MQRLRCCDKKADAVNRLIINGYINAFSIRCNLYQRSKVKRIQAEINYFLRNGRVCLRTAGKKVKTKNPGSQDCEPGSEMHLCT